MRRQSMTLAVLSVVVLSFALSARGPAQMLAQALTVDVSSAAYQSLAEAGMPATRQSGNQLLAHRSDDQVPPSALAPATAVLFSAQTALPSPTVAQTTPAATATPSSVPASRGEPPAATKPAPQMAPVSRSSTGQQVEAATARPAATVTPVSGQTAPIAVAVSKPAPPERIVAPSIGLDSKIVPVGWHEVTNPDGSKTEEWDVASYAVSWHKTSAKLGQVGNTVLTCHNNIEGEVFRHLEDFHIGDPITIYAGQRALKYVVTDKFIVQETGVPYAQRLENAKWIGPFRDERITLISCWPYTGNSHRIFIIAKPVKAG
jgi:LPXTG-site transpeptidase (sortase) family protein